MKHLQIGGGVRESLPVIRAKHALAERHRRPERLEVAEWKPAAAKGKS